MEIKNKILDVLDRGVDMTIATIRDDGYPQAITVSYVNDGLKIYFGTNPHSQKAQNIARNPKVSVTVNLPYTSWDQIKGVSLGGDCRKIEAPEELQRAGALMLKKFPQTLQYVSPKDPQELAMFCVEPKIVSLLDYTQYFGHTDLVTL
ncbi:MAG TPA: pyridoxamine 5'-phosphate oxidase family protein [Rhizomicrobium sp.]|jgi:nitroimidazol reductase NimA-like FMN-containing flavoprotein (pyridoxamine 5'-phosphate oxidase superfamily)|nr:pyridoxamine 5'-phosphate oxidase family protein [Rhizomicrobium sp.]